MSKTDEVTSRFYTRRRKPDDGHVVIFDGENSMQRLPVHEADVDFVCAAMNAADRREKKCTV
jgi:hypothetical protein